MKAAVTLGLAAPGSAPSDIRTPGGQRLSSARWRAVDATDFQRACDAYAEANGAAQTGQGSDGSTFDAVLGTLLPVFAGALLTLAADDVKQAAGRRWAMGEEVRSAWREFEAAVDSFVKEAEPEGQPLPRPDTVNGARRGLEATLRKAGAAYRRFPEVRALLETLSGDTLGLKAFGRGWTARDRAGPTRACLDSCRVTAEELAARLERGMRLPWPRRGKRT